MEKLDKHNQDRLRAVQDRIARARKSRMKALVLEAQSDKSSLSRGEITVTHLSLMRGRGRGIGRGGAGVIVSDEGSGDSDQIMIGDYDQADTIAYGDKRDLTDSHIADKDPGGDQP